MLTENSTHGDGLIGSGRWALAEKLVHLIAQKGFSGTAGVIGLNILYHADLDADNWIGPAVVGLCLTTLAVVVEFIMWREATRHYRERIAALEADRKRIDSRLQAYDDAFISHLQKNSSG